MGVWGSSLDGGDGKRYEKYLGSSKATEYYTSHYDAAAALWLCSVCRCSFLNLCKDCFEYFAWEGKQGRGCVRRIESEARKRDWGTYRH